MKFHRHWQPDMDETEMLFGYMPVIDIELKFGLCPPVSESFLIDVGSDISLASREIGELLGIPWESGRPFELSGITDREECRIAGRIHEVQIWLEEIAHRLPWPRNVWMGVSVERADYTFRIEHLRRIPAAVRFLSLEPLLGPLPRLDLGNIDWVIVGGESGRSARPMKEEWAIEVLGQCRRAGVPFFFKRKSHQSGATMRASRSGPDMFQ